MHMTVPCRKRLLACCRKERALAIFTGCALALASAAHSAPQLDGSDASPLPPRPEIVRVRMRDGIAIVLALYLPSGKAKVPALLAASPYRIDNDGVPTVPAFPFRETGPIGWYVDQGYAVVRMDVRGTGRSGGEYRVLDAHEQADLYDVVEWIAKQPWSSGKVGGLGQSYYARSQWAMATQAPPHLACIAPYDGNIDNYSASAYTGGIPGSYLNFWFGLVRGINVAPFSGTPRLLPYDFSAAILEHANYDDFWKERSAAQKLSKVRIPVFSIGVWGKADLHLNGNIVGYQQVDGPKKLLLLGGSGVDAAVSEFARVAFHARFLLPFYDYCLKGLHTSYESESEVRYSVLGSDQVRTARSWPPPESRPAHWYFAAGHSGSITSLNDGRLSEAPPGAAGEAVTLRYPDPHWSNSGNVQRGENGAVDTARHVLTFTSPPLASDVLLAGPSMLRVFMSSSRSDGDIIVKLYEQLPQSADERQKDVQPSSRLITKGWLRASHRAVDPVLSRENAPWYRGTAEPLTPGKIYRLDVALMPIAARLRRDHRIRIEISNADSALTEGVFTHAYRADQVGSYTLYQDSAHPSELTLPVVSGK